jgi:hypothetical protein
VSLVLLAAILAVAAVAAATVFAVVRTREFFRRFRAFGVAVDEALAAVTAGTDRIAAKSATVGPSELEPALARLAVSRARLAVLLAAIDDVRELVARVTGLRPRK